MKQLVPAKLEDYAAAHSAPESPECRAIREETYRTQDCPQMVVGPLEAAFLKVMGLAGESGCGKSTIAQGRHLYGLQRAGNGRGTS